jgi:integrase
MERHSTVSPSQEEHTMAYIQTRTRKREGVKHTVYASGTDGKRHSLGTYSDYTEALAKKKEADDLDILRKTGAGNLSEAHESLRTLSDYVTDLGPRGYRARTTIEPNTWVNYEGTLRLHILPFMGHKTVREIKRADVQALVTHLTSKSVGSPTIKRAKMVLSAVFLTLMEHNVVESNPCSKIKTPPIAKQEKPIFTPEEVKRLIGALPPGGPRLYATLLIETGMRQGEASELRPLDIDWRTGTIQVTRAVSDVGDSWNPANTGRFFVKTTKSGKARFVTISDSLLRALTEYREINNIGVEGLLFPAGLVDPQYGMRVRRRNIEAPTLTRDLIESLGITEPNENGKQYRHGTTSGYGPGKCRCTYCTQAAREYARKWNAKHSTQSRKRRGTVRTNKTGHLPRDVWYEVWYDACAEAHIPYHVAPHSLRHSFATWMLRAGKDLSWVQDKMGHANIATTQGYLHRISAEDRSGSAIMEGLLA